MQGTIVDRQPACFVGLKVVGTYETLGDMIPQVRRALLARQYEIESILDPDEQLGVTRPQDHEAEEGQVTTYFGFQVAGFKNVPADMVSMDLPAGRYARFEWRGSLESEQFEAFYPGMFNWFQEQGLTPSGAAPWIEVYGQDYDWDDRENPANRLTVLMPIGGSV